MCAYVASKHDVGLLKQDGVTVVGLILAKDKDGNKIYEEYDDEYLAVHQTAEAGYDALQPEKEFRIGQESYRSGYGLREYDANDPERYHVSTNVDHRNKGMALPVYDITAASPPTTPPIPTITNADFEIGASPTAGYGWTAGQGTWAIDTAQYHKTASSWKETGCSTGDNIYQDLTTTTYARGVEYVFKIWVYADESTTTFKATINDGVSSGDSSTVTAHNTWTQLTATHTVALTATQLRLTVSVANGVAGSAWVDDATITSITTPTIGAVTHRGKAEFNDNLYVAFGTVLTKLNSAGTAFDIVADMSLAITCLEPFTDSKLYICLGTSQTYYQMTTAEAFTINNLTVKTFQYMVTVHGTSPTMWGNDSDNTIRSTVNPAAGGTQWSTPATTISSSYTAITDLLAFNNLLYIMKEDRPYYLTSAGAVTILTNITRAISHADGGRNSLEWNGNIYMPWSTEALLEYNDTDSTFTWLNPSKFATESPSYDGQIQALAGDEEWLFAAVDNGTLVEIMCGRYETINGTTSWVWHPYKEITLTGCETMFISAVVQKRLWIFSDTAGEAINYIPLPTGYGDVAEDTNRDFAASGAFETPWHHANFKGDYKAFIKCTLRTANCSSSIYWTAKYKKLGDTAWTTIGNFTTSPSQTIYIPVDASSANPTSVAMKFQFSYTTNSTTTAPILYGWDIRGILYPTRRDLIYCEVRCANDLTLNDDTIDRDTNATQIKDTLVELKNTATYPALFYDLEGATTRVRHLSTGKPFSKIVSMPTTEGKKKSERRYYLLLEKVPGV